MNYWLTTQWPAVKDGRPRTVGVFLKADNADVAREMRPGDMVLIYEFKTGPAEVRRGSGGQLRRLDRWPGREGIVVVAKVVGRMKAPDGAPTLTVGRDGECWIRIVDMKLPNYSGFVPRRQVNRILGFKPAGRLRGIGARSAGLYRLSEEQFQQLLRVFRTRQPVKPGWGD